MKYILAIGKPAGLGLAAFAAGWGFTAVVSALAGAGNNYTTPVYTAEFWLNSVAWLAPFTVAAALLLWRRSKNLLQYCGAFFLGTWIWVFWPIGADLRGRTRVPGISATLSQVAARLWAKGPALLVCVTLAVALCALYVWYRRAIGRRYSRVFTALFLLAALVLGTAFLWVRGELSGAPMAVRAQSKTDVGFYALTQDCPNVKDYLVLYVMHRDFLFQYVHVWSNMPGKPILYYYLANLGMGPREIAIFTVVVCSLAAVPLFFVARRFISTEAAAGAAVLYYFIPTIPLFLPSSNTMTPLFALGCLWLALWCLERRMPEIALFTGVCLGLLFFYEPIPFALALLLAPLIYRALRQAPGRTALCLGLLAMGFGLVCAAWTLFTGIPATYLGGEALRLGVRFNQMFHREYGVFVFQNFREFLVAIGAVAALLWASGAAGAAKEIFRQPRQALRKGFVDESSAPAFVFCFTALMVIMAVAGLSRGEVDRLWIFLTPLAVICALWGAERLSMRNAVPVVAAWMFLEWLFRSVDELHHWLF